MQAAATGLLRLAAHHYCPHSVLRVLRCKPGRSGNRHCCDKCALWFGCSQSAAEAGAERHRKEALGEETKESVAARAWASACCKRVARAMSAAAAVAGPEGRSSALLAQLRQKLEQRRAREVRTAASSSSAAGAASRFAARSAAARVGERAAHVDVTDVGEGKDEDDGDDDGSGAEGRGQEEQLFPLESMARVVGALRLAMHARMRTNAEQEAIRQEFERTVSARIREGHAREDLLLEEHRRMEMRHKDEEDRLTEMQSKLVLELRDLSEAEARRRAALESDIEQRETAIRAGAEDRTHRLVDSLSAAKAALTEAEERDLTEEARLRKVSRRSCARAWKAVCACARVCAGQGRGCIGSRTVPLICAVVVRRTTRLPEPLLHWPGGGLALPLPMNAQLRTTLRCPGSRVSSCAGVPAGTQLPGARPGRAPRHVRQDDAGAAGQGEGPDG